MDFVEGFAPFRVWHILCGMESLREHRSHIGELMLYEGLLQARYEHISQTNIEAVYFIVLVPQNPWLTPYTIERDKRHISKYIKTAH